MFPAHYAVPDGLDIRLIGTARWRASTKSGENVLSLWQGQDGTAYYCIEIWHPSSPKFWETTSMSDLIEVTFSQFLDLTDTISKAAPWELPGLSYRFAELAYLWGYAEGRINYASWEVEQ